MRWPVRHGSPERLALRAPDLSVPGERIVSVENVPPLDDIVGLRLAANWGWFSPVGPAECFLALVPVRDGESWLVYVRELHPSAARATVAGRVPRRVADDPAQLESALAPVAEQGLLGVGASAPTHVMPIDTSPLGAGGQRRLLLAAVASSVSADRLAGACRMLRAYRLRPWDRANQELYLTVTGASRRLAEAEAPSDAAPVRPGADALAAWWDLVTDPEHVASEERELGTAWQGVIEFHGTGKHRTGTQTMGWDRATAAIYQLRRAP